MKRPMIEYIIEALEPTFAEMIDSCAYYTEYSDSLVLLKKRFKLGDGVEVINSSMKRFYSWSAHHAACTDVASCLESLCQEEYAHKFTY